MYRKILVGIDLSGDDELLLQKAQQLAATFSASLRAVYVLEQPIAVFGEFTLAQPLIDIETMRAELLPHFQKLAVKNGLETEQLAIVEGQPAPMLLQQAQQWQCDLIILGSHGKHGVQLLLGSTAAKISHHASCDVLSIRIHE